MALAAKVRRAIRSSPSYCRQFLDLRPCKVWRYSPSRCRVGGGALHGSDGKSSPCALRHAWKDRTELVSFSLALGIRSSQGLIFGKAGRRRRRGGGQSGSEGPQDFR